MNRKQRTFKIQTTDFIAKLIHYLRSQSTFVVLDTNEYPKHRFYFIVAWGVLKSFNHTDGDIFSNLYEFHSSTNDWLFGHLSYDLKNYIEDLSSNRPDNIRFPMIHFFQPIYILEIEHDEAKYYYIEDDDDIVTIHQIITSTKIANTELLSLVFKKRITKEHYISNIQKIKQHIQLGDIYEMNFCQEFYADNIETDPFQLFLNIKEHQPMPFSSFYRLGDKFLLCASPERYLMKDARTVISQPIKGTIKRGANEQEDKEQYYKLLNSEKDRAENIMIVDLVRNDLSRTAEPSSVRVKELCGTYAFPSVYQMISTVQSTIRPDVTFADVVKTTFPMGSMTGAPKIKAMQLIEQYESMRRGLYSGSVGYITPDADFDFNVVIRSLQYNSSEKYASIITGGAITIHSNPEEEYNECLVKANGLLKAINSSIEL